MSLLNYKENPDRCVYVSGQINDEMASRLAPTLNKMRVASNEPITFYIDSPGGDILAADLIRNLAKAPDPNGNSRDLVSVVIGGASSAAADLLAHGDYAIAYNHSYLVYHGTRQQPRNVITYEAATSLASSLQRTNEMYALRLARRCFRRFIYPVSQLTAFQDYKNSEDHSITPLAKELGAKLAYSNRQLVLDAQAKCETISAMSNYVVDKVFRPSKSKSAPSKSRNGGFGKKILDAIISYKISQHKGRERVREIDSYMLDEITGDFRVFEDFHFGQHTRDGDGLIGAFGALLLNDEDSLEYQRMLESKKDQKSTNEWLQRQVGNKMKHLWYFTVSLSRILQTDDFWLSPSEAFWLGLVDEVPGSDITPLRLLTE